MTKLDIEIPDFLKKRGITSVEDNIPEKHTMVPPSSEFMILFGDELINHVKVKSPNTGSGSIDESPVKDEPAEQAHQKKLREFMEEQERKRQKELREFTEELERSKKR